ncbi:hypothetical protein BGV91_gp12 [Haloarcula californiae icosahedral virus 1]|uniref:Uncharacterized protein n=1 Tax=Haloarcula californiae icosahedral virus 1 TaxID=1735722 RepID=A0A1C7A3Q4_9VIRU|nr:hypothetical protein BGV91_gp12 [Haloarcula californiae icosahedral virus 1]ALJ99675.1 hypothetical protein SS136_012 [Haloarcula californiae icosahedral virus 1]
MPDDDLPAVREERVRDPDADEWKPLTGPMEWERRTHGDEGEWTVGGDPSEVDEVKALVVRDGFNDEEWIISSLYAPDLNRML